MSDPTRPDLAPGGQPLQTQQPISTCPKCGSTVFVEKRGTAMTILGVLLLFAAIVPGVLVLWLAPKHTECARCGKHL